MDDVRRKKTGDVLLGEDWISPEAVADPALRSARGRKGLFSLNRSPLARKIIIFNLMALVILLAGVLFLNPFRDSLVLQREDGLGIRSPPCRRCVRSADARQRRRQSGRRGTALRCARRLMALISAKASKFLFSIPLAQFWPRRLVTQNPSPPSARAGKSTIITDFLNGVWETVSGVLSSSDDPGQKVDVEAMARGLFEQAHAG